MNAKKRVSRKELLKKPDEFITTTHHIVDYVQHDARTIYSVVIVLACVLALVGVGYLYFSEKRKEAVALEREAVETYYQAILSDTANNTVNEPKCKAAIDKFKRLIDEHGGTPQSQRAGLYLADAYYQLKKYTQAQEAYKAYLEKYKPQGIFRYTVLNSLGQIEETQGKYNQALEYYKQSAEGASIALQAQAKLEIGRCYERLAKTEMARQTYQEALKLLPDKPTYRQLIGRIKLNISTL